MTSEMECHVVVVAAAYNHYDGVFLQEVIGQALDHITSYTELNNKEQVVALIDKVS